MSLRFSHPSLSASSSSSLLSLGWTPARQDQLTDPSHVPARIVVQHRGVYGLGGAACTTGHLAGRFHHDGTPPPTVGDWVAVAPAGELGIIHAILPRTSALSRGRPGTPAEAQLIAANVDVVFVVTAPGPALNLRRLERYLTAVYAAGARPVVVVTKHDLGDDVEAARAALGTVAPGVACHFTSAVTGAGLAAVVAELPAGSTGALVGSSGVGKSSLLNALLGDDRQSTAAIRLGDGKGRHTTTRRELVPLPWGASLIDTPGMREFALWDAAAGQEQTFADIAVLAADCRFRDCQHEGEPGCAVAVALAEGRLGADRMGSFAKLKREEAYAERLRDPREQAASKGRWKSIHKQQRARRKLDPKLRDD